MSRRSISILGLIRRKRPSRLATNAFLYYQQLFGSASQGHFRYGALFGRALHVEARLRTFGQELAQKIHCFIA
jgi:hypothetical protein